MYHFQCQVKNVTKTPADPTLTVLNTPSKAQCAEQREYCATSVARIFAKRAESVTEYDCKEIEPTERTAGSV